MPLVWLCPGGFDDSGSSDPEFHDLGDGSLVPKHYDVPSWQSYGDDSSETLDSSTEEEPQYMAVRPEHLEEDEHGNVLLLMPPGAQELAVQGQHPAFSPYGAHEATAEMGEEPHYMVVLPEHLEEGPDGHVLVPMPPGAHETAALGHAAFSPYGAHEEEHKESIAQRIAALNEEEKAEQNLVAALYSAAPHGAALHSVAPAEMPAEYKESESISQKIAALKEEAKAEQNLVAALHSAAPHSAAPHGAALHSVAPHTAALHGVAPHGAAPAAPLIMPAEHQELISKKIAAMKEEAKAQHSAARHGAALHGTKPHRAAPHGAALHGTKPHRAAKHGAVPHGTTQRHPAKKIA